MAAQGAAMAEGTSPDPLAQRLSAAKPIGAGSASILSLVYFAAATLVSFVLSPFLLKRLGDAPFGLLSVSWELGGYFGLLNLGLRNAVNYFVARSAASARYDELRDVVRTAFWLLFCLTCLGMALSFPVAWYLPRWIDTGPIEIGVVRKVLWLGLAVFALNLTGTMAAAVLAGLRRFDLLTMTNIVGAVGGGLLVLLAAQAGLSLVFVAMFQAAGAVLPWVIQQGILNKWGLASSLWPPRIQRGLAARLASYGSANLAMHVCGILTFQSDQILIIQAAGPSAVALYTIGRHVAYHSRSLINVVTMVLSPYFTDLAVRQASAEARRFFLRLDCWINCLAALLLGGVISMGRPFLDLWVGPRYSTGDFWNRSDVVLLFFALAMWLRAATAVPYQYLLGSRRLRLVTAAVALESAFVIVFGIAAVRWKGVAAVALVKLVSSFFFAFAALVPDTLRGLQIPAREYLRHSLVPALLVGGATLGTGLLLARWVTLSNWAVFFAAACVAAAAGALTFWFAIAGPEDREFVLRKLRNPLG